MANSLPYSRVVDVTVTRMDRFPTTRGFSVALLLISASKAGTLDVSNRTKLYADMTEVALDWDSSTEPYKAAARYFSARIRPRALKMGYRNPAAASIATELDTIYAADSDWYWMIHTKELNDTAAQRAVADWAETKKVIFGGDSNDTDTEAASAVADLSSTVTISIAAPGVVTWTGHALIAGDEVVFTTSGALPTGITAGTTYYVLSSGITANTFQIGATAGGSAITTSGTQSGTHTATAPRYGGSFAEYIESKNYDRSAAFYHTDANSYLAAAAFAYSAGRDLDRSNYKLAKKGVIDSGQAYTLKFKNLPGVTAISKPSAAVQGVTGFVPGTGISASAGHRANTYVNIGGEDMLVEGSVGSGAFIDEIHAADWIVARTQESVLSVLTNNARIPYTNQGVAFLIGGGVEPPLRRAFAAGVIAPKLDDDGNLQPSYEIAVDDVANIIESQRRNRIAPDIKVTFRYSGAIHYASVTMTMKF